LLQIGPMQLWHPHLASLDLVALGLALSALYALTRLGWPLLGVLGAAAALSLGTALMALV